MPRVKAKRTIFYGGSRRRPGAVFDIGDKRDDDGNLVEFSPSSMELVDDDTPLRTRLPLKGEAPRTVKAADVNPNGGAISRDTDVKPEGDAVDLQSAVSRLDHTIDAHWTKEGKPNLNALKEMIGKAVTRGEVEDAFPELKRRDQS